MKLNESTKIPFELDSPVEFVLVGVVRNRRAVVAKSKGAQIDLVAYAQKEYAHNGESSHPLRLFPFPIRAQLKPISVDSQPTNFYSNHVYDERASEWTFVWRGAAYSRHEEEIMKEFQLRITDIVRAFDDNSISHLEWAISPIIDLCNRATSYTKRKRLSFIYAFWFTSIIYLAGMTAYFFSRWM